MSNFNFYRSNRVYNDIYFQYPKVFIYGDKYKSLSEGAKLAYMLLKNELTKAIEKDQVDEEGYIYFEMTVSYLSALMNCSESKVIRVKKELEKAELLLQVHMGFDRRSGKNNPNRLYLAELDVTDQDVYLMQKNAKTLDNSGTVKMTGCSEINTEAETPYNSGTVKMTGCSEIAETLDNSGTVKMTANVYKYNTLDTNRHLIDSDKDELQDKLLLENFVEINSNSQRVNATFVPDNVLKLIQTFSPSYSVAQTTVKTIHNAKNKAEQIAGIKMAYEEMDDFVPNPDQGLYNTVLRAYQKQKTEEVKDIQNVIFTYVKNWFVEYPIQAKKTAQESDTLPEVSLHNWIE
jgi:hypothetical protein